MFLLFNTSLLSAATSGKIEGFVKDAVTGEALPGANVMLKGTSLGAATDLKGHYVIANVPPGTYTLLARYIGYSDKSIEVAVKPNLTVKHDFALNFVSLKGQEVVVTAQAEGQLEAINQQLAARSIINVVSSARIQELPDANAAESVGRLPGVAILRSGGEGNKVIIRGLAPKYNTITINGVRMAATGSGDRSTDLSMISPYMLEGIEVMKAVTPDQDADAIGGSVNFKIKEAKKGFRSDLLVQGGYNGLQNTYNDYKLMASVSNRFFNNRLGALLQVDIESRNRSSDEFGANYRIDNPELNVPNDVKISSLNLQDFFRRRKRYGGTFVLDYSLPNGRINMTNFGSLIDNKNQTFKEIYSLQNNEHSYVTSDRQNRLTIMTNVINYEQSFSYLKLDAMASHSMAENRSPDDLSFAFTETAAFSNVDESVHPSFIPTFAKNDLDNTYLKTINNSYNYVRENEFTTAGNIEFDFLNSRQVSAKIKIGGKYRHKKRVYNHDEIFQPIDWGGRARVRDAVLEAFPWMQETTPLGSSRLPYELFIDPDYDPGEFLQGAYILGPVADIELMREVNKITKPLSWWHAENSTKNDYSGNEDYSAGYIMADLNIGSQITIIPGVRYESNRTSYRGIRGDATADQPHIRYIHTDTTTVRTNAFWLPMVHFRYKPFSWFDVRFAYTNTLSRPNYNQIIPSWNIQQQSVSWNNYRLKPSHSTNYDLYFSFHGNKIGLFTAGLFYKKIKDLIFGTGRRAIVDPAEYGLPSWEKGKTISSQINNKFAVDLWGMELDWQTHFWYLPGPLNGLVLNTNYTHIFSEAKYPRSIIKTEYLLEPPWIRQTNVDTFYTNRLVNQPNDIVNLAIGYDFKGFSARLSMLFQTDIFKSNNFWPELRGFTDDYLRWDLSIKQNLPIKRLQFYLNFNNITEALDRNLNQGTRFPTREQFYGRTVDAGLRYRFN